VYHTSGRTQLESVVLIRVFEPVRENITGGWGKINVEEFLNFFILFAK
jgi:hypothetical protein